MKGKTLITAGGILLWSAFQATVVLPSAMVGTALMLCFVAGHSPIVGILEYEYEWATTAVRDAGPGYVLQERCVEFEPSLKNADPQPLESYCAITTKAPVPVGNYIAQDVEILKITYFCMVGISVVWLLVFGSWSGLFRLPESDRGRVYPDLWARVRANLGIR